MLGDLRKEDGENKAGLQHNVCCMPREASEAVLFLETSN